jgi:hypothetical protein
MLPATVQHQVHDRDEPGAYRPAALVAGLGDAERAQVAVGPVEPGEEEDAADDHRHELDDGDQVDHLRDRDQLVERGARAAEEPEPVHADPGDTEHDREPQPA